MIMHEVKRHQRGAAMSETIILMFVALPLMFFIPMLGKLIDARQQAIGAARYAAWENVVAPGIAPAGQVQQRFFGERAIALSSAPSQATSNELWGQGNRRDWSLSGFGASLPALDGLGVRLAEDHIAADVTRPEPGTVSGAIGTAAEVSGKLLSWAPRTDWSIMPNGLAAAHVSAGIESNALLDKAERSCGSALGGCLHETSVVMVDGWAARDDAQTADRVRSFVPAGVLHPVGKALANTLGRLPLINEVKKLENTFGYVNMSQEAMPLDRYVDPEQ